MSSIMSARSSVRSCTHPNITSTRQRHGLTLLLTPASNHQPPPSCHMPTLHVCMCGHGAQSPEACPRVCLLKGCTYVNVVDLDLLVLHLHGLVGPLHGRHGRQRVLDRVQREVRLPPHPTHKGRHTSRESASTPEVSLPSRFRQL